MPRTVDEGFRDFLRALTPAGTESESAKKHRASIEARLTTDFGLLRFFRTGSFGNGTSISGYSDVDYFASIPTANLSQNSDYTLTRVRDSLDQRFPYTGVRVNCPAVRVPFGTYQSETTEVVPADLISKTDAGHHIYGIPNCAGGWMRTSPETHNAYVREIDQRLNGKVKPLIRFIKAGKYFKQVQISSFYLELRAARYAEGETSIVYSIDVKRVLDLLYKKNLADMQDPMGISGYVQACSTDAKLEDARSKLLTALVRAEKACEAEGKDSTKEAFYWWDLLYGFRFPSYYY
jgi:Second Messenger Oligonucleotide or Dinucleotide Synthetase domain